MSSALTSSNSSESQKNIAVTSPGPWRLGLDIGVGSIGWAVYRVRPNEPEQQFAGGDLSLFASLDEPAIVNGTQWYTPIALVDGGVTIFDSGVDQHQKTASAQRRLFRSQRTHIKNTRDRKRALLQRLVSLGFLSSDPIIRKRHRDEKRFVGLFDEFAIPASWAWRWEGIHGTLTPHELGCVLMALCAARGQTFSIDSKSANRLEDASALERAIKSAGCITFGEYAAVQLAQNRQQIVRARRGVPNYCSRTMVIHEFDTICNRQQAIIPVAIAKELRALIFDQEFTSVLPPGRCPIFPHEDRFPIAHPMTQRLKILQMLRNIRVESSCGPDGLFAMEDRHLTPEEEQQAMLFLRDKKDVSPMRLFFAIGLKGQRSNYHRAHKNRKDDDVDIVGDATGHALSHSKAFGSAWFDFDEQQRQAIVEEMLQYRENDPATGRRRCPDYVDLARRWGITEENARNAFDNLPRGRSAYGRTATYAIAQRLEAYPQEGLHEARQALYPQHDEKIPVRGRLPYYGQILPDAVFDGDPDAQRAPKEPLAAYEERRYGRVRNPQVHVAIQQIRGLVNAIIEAYGSPAEIVVELARDLCESPKQRKERERAMRDRKKRREAVVDILKRDGIKPTQYNIEKYMLWEDLGPLPEARLDIYSGTPIPHHAMLYSGDIQVDHIIPRALCGDDSLANKIVTFTQMNQDKKDRLPFQAFHGQQYGEIKKRAQDVYGGDRKDKARMRKYRRFLESAEKEFVTDADFAGRELAATAYAAKVVRRYLTAVLDGAHVHAAHGRLTGRLRKAWDLSTLLPRHEEAIAIAQRLHLEGHDEKINPELKRFDHRHHLIDAAIIGMIDPTTIRKFFQMSERDLLKKDERKQDFPFRDSLESIIHATIVRHRPYHKQGYTYAGAGVKATRYRLAKTTEKRQVILRQDIFSLGIANGIWQLGKTDDDFSENILRAIEQSGAFSVEQIAIAKTTFAQQYFKDLMSRFHWDAYITKEQAKQAFIKHRTLVWKRLCDEFTTAIGGQSTYSNMRTMNTLIQTSSGAMMEPGGYAFADIYIQKHANGKTSYRMAPVYLHEAANRTRVATQPAEGEHLLCRIHHGDTLRLYLDGVPSYVVVKSFNGQKKSISIAMHHNAARTSGRMLSANIPIEGPSGSCGSRTVAWVFGVAKARIVRIGPLGRYGTINQRSKI